MLANNELQRMLQILFQKRELELFNACKKGLSDIVKDLISKQINVNHVKISTTKFPI